MLGLLTVDGYQKEISSTSYYYLLRFLILTLVLWGLFCGQKHVINAVNNSYFEPEVLPDGS